MSLFISPPKDKEKVVDRVAALLDKPGRILLVDDDQYFNEMFCRLSEFYDVEIHVAQSLAGARAWMSGMEPDGLILDYLLSNGEGVQLYAEILKTRPKINVIFLSAYGSQAREKVEAVGPARVYSKDRLGDPGFIAALFAQLGVRPRVSPAC